jgi:PTS system nitrogen regulatory IIA component
MQIADILSVERVCCDIPSRSKKAALEAAARLIAGAEPGLSDADVFDSLIARERLGSTGLGHGVALPHGRRKLGDRTLGAFIRLQSAIDYDAIDQQPVDILFALLVPEKSTEEHLQILSQLAERFSNPALLEKLRSEPSSEEIFRLLAD